MRQARKVLAPTNGAYMHTPVMSDQFRRQYEKMFASLIDAANQADYLGASWKSMTAKAVGSDLQEKWRKKGWRVTDYMVHPFYKTRAKVLSHVNAKRGDRKVVLSPLGMIQEYADMVAVGWYSPVEQEHRRVTANEKMKPGERRIPAPLTEEQKKDLLKVFTTTTKEN